MGVNGSKQIAANKLYVIIPGKTAIVNGQLIVIEIQPLVKLSIKCAVKSMINYYQLSLTHY